MAKKGRKVLGFFCILVLSVPQISFANEQQITELQNKIKDSTDVIQNLDAEISQYQQQLNHVSGERKTLETAVKELQLTDKRLQTSIQSTSFKIEDTEKNIQTIDLTISEIEDKIDRNKYLIIKYIQSINEIEYTPITLSILGDRELSSMIQTLNSYNRLQYVFNTEVKNFTDHLEDLGVSKRTKEEERAYFENLVSDNKIEKATIQKTKSQKDNLLKTTKSQESEYQKLINEKTALKKQFEDSLSQLESQLHYVLDPKSYPQPKFGIFSWPLDYVFITQPFGLTADSFKLYSYRSGVWSGRHTGVDFRANNDKVYSIGVGTVIDFGNTDLVCPNASYGGWVLVRHDNGLSSIYSHLSSVIASKGQKVQAGTLIAISGNSGYSTGPHLDLKLVPSDAVSVETWTSKGCSGKNYTTPLVSGSVYFDPLGYLPKASLDMFK